MWKPNGPVTRRPVRVLARSDAALSRLSAVHQTVILGSDVGRLLEHPIHPPSTSRLDCANTDYIITPGAPPLHLLFVCQGISTALFTPTLPTLLYLAHLLSILYQSEAEFSLAASVLFLSPAGWCSVPERTQGEAERERGGGQ